MRGLGTWGRVVGAAVVVTAVLSSARGVAAQGAQSAPPEYRQMSRGAIQTFARSFPFVGNELRVTIHGAAAGRLHVVRGEMGTVNVFSRATGGLALGVLDGPIDQGEMTLESGPASRVDYVLTIPAETRLTVRVAGHPGATLSPLDMTGNWSWGAQPAEPAVALPQ